MIKFPVKISDFIRILPFNEGHLTNQYVKWLNDPEVVRYSEQRHHSHTLETVWEYYEAQQNSAHGFLAIEYLEEMPIHIGNIGVFIDRENNTSDLSIMVGDKNYRGKGIAGRAWQLCLNTLLDELGFRMVTAGTMDVNKPMISLMKKSGMNIDGKLPKRLVWEGREVSVVCASKLSTKYTLAGML